MLLLALGLAGALLQTPAAPDDGVVSGVVLEHDTRTPVPGARVDLMLQLDRAPATSFDVRPRTVVTDADGRFLFTAVAPGRYRVNARKAGFAVGFGPGIAPPVTVTAGARVDALEVLLTRGGVIVGRVVDASGEPVTDVRVMALRTAPLPPRRAGTGVAPTEGARRGRRLMPGGPGAETNELGEFRLHSLLPGEYYLQAMPNGLGGGALGQGGAATTTIVPTFYPGTTDQAAAQAITVRAGAPADAGELRMVVAAAFQVSGIVVDEAGRPVPGVMVRLMPQNAPAGAMVMAPMSGQARTEANGTFVLDNVTSGAYTLLAVPGRVVARNPQAAAGGIGAGSTAFGWGSTSSGSIAGSVRTETRNGTTVEFRDELATQVPVVVGNDAVTGLQVVVRRPPGR